MIMGALPVGIRVPKANAPTRVMLMPANMMHRPQAQHKAGEGRLWCSKVRGLEGFLGAGGLEVFSGFTMFQ